jgi:D-tagatose-1,6-bisphosphate aldolase subunit GatZ/KbaZ
MVLRAAMEQGLQDETPVLIEATCNQVDQFGGYTGMTPATFLEFVLVLADEVGIPADRIILGGDHLGPNPWRGEPARVAMDKAEDLVDAYVSAGFHKIHLDASMRCADDPAVLPETTIAERAARLCRRAEAAADRRAGGPPPVYVIGTEVPPPGGSVEEEAGPRPTPASDVARTLDISEAAFRQLELGSAWERVVALVVQPGVEFGDATVHDYDRELATPLVQAIAARSPWMYEAHSTDYQTPGALRRLVEDRFAILKVGPWLTFALREALFSLEEIARELHRRDSARVIPRLAEALEAAMLRDPRHWAGHYHGSEGDKAFSRQFSLSDRSRYYWGDEKVRAETRRLLEATEGPLPLQLLSQFRPHQYEAVRAGIIPPNGRSIAIHAVRRVLGHYASACGKPPSVPEGLP